MDKCQELEALLRSQYLDISAGGFRPSAKEIVEQLGDVRDCIVQGLQQTASTRDWHMFNRYLVAAFHQPSPAMAPLVWSVLDPWKGIFAQASGDRWEGPHLEDMADFLGVSGHPGAVPSLERAIHNEPEWDEFHQFARKCIWSLKAIGTPEAHAALQRVAQSDDPELRQLAHAELEGDD